MTQRHVDGVKVFRMLMLFGTALSVFVSVAQAEKVLLQDDFSGIAAGTRPTPPYEFSGMPPVPPSTDGVIAIESHLAVLVMQRLEPDAEYPQPSVTRVFPRQTFDSGKEVELSFDIRAKSDTGSTVQFHVRNAVTGASGDGQMVYFKPAQGMWLLDAARVKHSIVDHSLEVGVWYRVTMTFDLAKRSVLAMVRNVQTEEMVGQSPQVDLFGKEATYLDRFVIARAETPILYDYEFTNLTLIEK